MMFSAIIAMYVMIQFYYMSPHDIVLLLCMQVFRACGFILLVDKHA